MHRVHKTFEIGVQQPDHVRALDTIREAGEIAHIGDPDDCVDGLAKPAPYVTRQNPLANTFAEIGVEHVLRDLAARNNLDVERQGRAQDLDGLDHTAWETSSLAG